MAHPPVHQSRRRPATATAESGQRQRSPEQAWRSHLDSTPVFVGSRCDGAAHPDHSIGRGDYLPRHPAWWSQCPGRSTSVASGSTPPVPVAECARRSTNEKNTRRGRGPEPHPAVGGNHPSKATCLSSVVKGWQKGPFSPRGLRRQSKDRLYEPRSRYLRDLFKILFPNCLDHTLLSPAARSTVPS